MRGRLTLSLLHGHPSPLVLAIVEDITDKNAAEDARLRYAAIVESSDDAIVSKNLDAVIVSWNAGAQRIFGYVEKEVVGQPITILIPPELWDEEDKILARLRAGERIEHFETIRVTKTGKKVDVSLSISSIRDATGKVVGFSKIARDITERKRAEDALRTSEERLRLALQAADLGTFEWNIQTGVNRWTPELEALYGLPPGGFGGTQTAFENLVHPDDRARVIQLNHWALKSGHPTQGEWRVVWPDGSVHWISGRWQVFRSESGEPSRMVGINADVTDRKLADAALRESEERLRLATQAGRMFAYDWDVTTDMVMRSAEHVKILGLREPMRFPHQQFVEKIYPDDRTKFLSAIARLTPKNPNGEVTYRALASDGALVWLKSNGHGFFDSEGRLLRVIGMVMDVTNVKRAEEALADMTRKLIESQEQERSRIGRELHDDITQRLAMLSVELEQLGDTRPEVRSQVQELRTELCQISDDVQAISHDLHSSKLEYLGVIAGMKSWCKEVADRHKIEVEFRSDVSGNLALEDGLPLFRVLQEAVNNAVKYSGENRVEVELREDSGEIHLIIRDSGKGFDVEAALRGKGLGLTSMRERVRLVNGTIAIESRPMGGTNIHVCIPLERRNKAERLSA